MGSRQEVIEGDHIVGEEDIRTEKSGLVSFAVNAEKSMVHYRCIGWHNQPHTEAEKNLISSLGPTKQDRNIEHSKSGHNIMRKK